MRELLVVEPVWRGMRERAASAVPFETGGVLLGVWAGSEPWVTAAPEVASEKPSRDLYVLPAGVTTEVVDAHRHDDPRIGYLGEWHTHPGDSGPSSRDQRTLRRLTGDDVRPVLAIVGCSGEGWRLKAWIWDQMALAGLSITLTGQVPSLSSGE